MTDEELAAIRARCEAATAGPWEWADSGLELCQADPGTKSIVRMGLDDTLWIYSLADAVFITCAREDMPKLLAEIDRLKKLVPPWRLKQRKRASSRRQDGGQHTPSSPAT